MSNLTKPATSSPWVGDVDVNELEIDVSGTLITQDPDTGYPDFLIINATYGTGALVDHGMVCPDEYRVFKPFIKDGGTDCIVGRVLGAKELRETVASNPEHSNQTETTSFDEQHRFALAPEQIMKLARIAQEIETDSEKPLTMEWVHDEETDRFYILKISDLESYQPHDANSVTIYELEDDNLHPIIPGIAIGPGIVHGKACFIADLASASAFIEGSILVTRFVDQDWLPLLEKAAGLVTDRGGRASQAAAMCRKLGIPAILGTVRGSHVLRDQRKITLDCSHSERGTVYHDSLNFQRNVINLENLPTTILNRRLSIDSPDAALQWWQLPTQGYGIAKIEDIMTHDIRIHPMALIRYDDIKDESLRFKIDRLTAGYEDRCHYFVDRLARGIASMAAVAYPNPIAVRLSDFTSEEYSRLMDHGLFEELEHSPKMGLRGAARYLSKSYRDAFELECQAILQARKDMGFTNINIAIPFCRTVQEAKKVIRILEKNGLDRRDEDLEIHLIAEVPSNIVLAHKFLPCFDRVDIDLDTLTQLILSIDPEDVGNEGIFDHEDPAVLSAIATLVTEAHSCGSQVTVFGLLQDHRSDLMEYLIDEDVDAFAFEPENFVRGSFQISKAEVLFDKKIADNQKKHDDQTTTGIQNPPH